MPRTRRDYLVTLDLTAGDDDAPETPYVELLATMLLPRIGIEHATGINCVAFRCGPELTIRVDRIIAERLRDDLTRWLKTNPAPSREEVRRMREG